MPFSRRCGISTTVIREIFALPSRRTGCWPITICKISSALLRLLRRSRNWQKSMVPPTRRLKSRPCASAKGDIQEISQALLQMLDIRYHKSHTFDANVWELLKNQPWPGNVRQLAHIIERLVLVVKSQTIQVKDVLRVMPRDVVAEERGNLDEEGHLRERTYEMIEKMSREGKSGAQIAKALGISRSTVYRIKRRHEDQ